jgi:hypothetical protein
VNVAALTMRVAHQKCREWQHRLRLQDWDVRLRIARLSEMADGCVGFCSQHPTKRIADIDILDQRDVEAKGQVDWDWEVTLVHELLHIPMSDVLKGDYTKTPEGIAAERMIDAVARASHGSSRRILIDAPDARGMERDRSTDAAGERVRRQAHR